MGKTPQFSCKMKMYIQNNVISSFPNDTHKPSYEYIYKKQLNTMMNGNHFFSIHHDDLGLFCSVCTTDSTHKFVVKYLRMFFFVYIQNTQIHSSKHILFFPQKQCTQCSSQPTQNCTYSDPHTIQKNLLIWWNEPVL